MVMNDLIHSHLSHVFHFSHHLFILEKVFYSKSLLHFNGLFKACDTQPASLTHFRNLVLTAENKNQCEFVGSHMNAFTRGKKNLFIPDLLQNVMSKAQNLQELPSVAVFF